MLAPSSRLLARRALRKHPGLVGTIGALSLITGLLVYAALMMLTQHGSYLSAKTREWNFPDVTVIAPSGEGADTITSTLGADERVADLETDETVLSQGSIPYGDSTLPTTYLFYDAGAAPRIGSWDVVEELGSPVADPVWAPSALKTAGGYSLGDELVFSSPLGERRFHIQGFVESSAGGTPLLGMLWLGLPSDGFHALRDQAREYYTDLAAQQAADGESRISPDSVPGWVPSSMIKARLVDPQEDTSSIIQVVSDLDVLGARTYDRDMLAIAQSTTVGLIAVIMLLFSTMITTISIVIQAFLQRAAIRDDLTTLGALRAMGYTTRGVLRPMVLCFALIALLGAALGAAGSHGVLPHMAEILSSQTGITWRPSIDPLLLTGTACALALLVWVTGAVVARRVRRMGAVEALHGGASAHSFRHAGLRLDLLPGRLATRLGLKSMLSAPGRTTLIMVVAMACTMAAVFSVAGLGALADKDRAKDTLLGATIADIEIRGRTSADVPTAVQKASSIAGVEEALPLSYESLVINGSDVSAEVVDDPESAPQSAIYEGRPATHANEIVIGPAIAKRYGLEPNDTWTVTTKEASAELLVTGLASGTSNGGNFIMLSQKAFHQLSPTTELAGAVVYLDSAADADSVTRALQDELGSGYRVSNYGKNIAIQIDSAISVVPILSRTLIAFTALIIVLVIALVTASQVARSRETSGLLKALGLTSAQAAARIRWSTLPPLLIGTALGYAIGISLVKPMLVGMLSGIGIMRISTAIPVSPPLLMTAGIMVTAMVAARLATRPIRGITAYSLMTE